MPPWRRGHASFALRGVPGACLALPHRAPGCVAAVVWAASAPTLEQRFGACPAHVRSSARARLRRSPVGRRWSAAASRWRSPEHAPPAQDMRRLHGSAEPWARFHHEHNHNDDIQVEPWQPAVWEAASNWTCRRAVTSAKPINIPPWLCKLIGALAPPPPGRGGPWAACLWLPPAACPAWRAGSKPGRSGARRHQRLHAL
jgi:hypothetical protein